MATERTFENMNNEKAATKDKGKKPIKSLKDLKERAKEMGVPSGAHVAKNKEAY